MRECLLVLMFVSASLVSQAALAGAGLQTRDERASSEDGAKKKMTATVVTVDPANSTISFEEIDMPVAITVSTVFDDEVKLDKLKPGTKVKLVLMTREDNKAEAVEIRKAG